MNIKLLLSIFTIAILSGSCSTNEDIANVADSNMKIRIAKIEIDSTYFDEYIAILKEEAANSVKLEEGVWCIYPMYEQEDRTQIRLLEIYASEEAYQLHLKTEHFLHYKTTTLPMVKSLELIDMEAIDIEMMSAIFEKIKL